MKKGTGRKAHVTRKLGAPIEGYFWKTEAFEALGNAGLLQKHAIGGFFRLFIAVIAFEASGFVMATSGKH